MNWSPDIFAYASAIFAVCVTVGGLMAIRQGYTRRVGEIQEKVIAAQKEQNDIQEKEIATLRRELQRVKQVVGALQRAFKRRGVTIEINGDGITIIDEQQSHRRQTIHIPIMDEGDPDEESKKEK